MRSNSVASSSITALNGGVRVTHVIHNKWSIAVRNNPTNSITAPVKWFDTNKGFGFIAGPDGDVFVRYLTITL